MQADWKYNRLRSFSAAELNTGWLLFPEELWSGKEQRGGMARAATVPREWSQAAPTRVPRYSSSTTVIYHLILQQIASEFACQTQEFLNTKNTVWTKMDTSCIPCLHPVQNYSLAKKLVLFPRARAMTIYWFSPSCTASRWGMPGVEV